MLLISDVFVLINYYSQILWLSVAACIVAQLWLRYTQPELPRPIKTSLWVPITFLVACAFLVIFPIPSQPWNTFIGAMIVLSGKQTFFTSQLLQFQLSHKTSQKFLIRHSSL